MAQLWSMVLMNVAVVVMIVAAINNNLEKARKPDHEEGCCGW